MEPDRIAPTLERVEWDAANGLTVLKRRDFGCRLSHQKHAVHPRQALHLPAQFRADSARLVGYAIGLMFYAIGLMFDEFRVSLDPRRSPVLDLNDPDAGRADGDDVNLVGLPMVCRGEGQVRQQYPLVITRLVDQRPLDVFECLALALVDSRPALNVYDFHIYIVLHSTPFFKRRQRREFRFLWHLQENSQPSGPIEHLEESYFHLIVTFK